MGLEEDNSRRRQKIINRCGKEAKRQLLPVECRGSEQVTAEF